MKSNQLQCLSKRYSVGINRLLKGVKQSLGVLLVTTIGVGIAQASDSGVERDFDGYETYKRKPSQIDWTYVDNQPGWSASVFNDAKAISISPSGYFTCLAHKPIGNNAPLCYRADEQIDWSDTKIRRCELTEVQQVGHWCNSAKRLMVDWMLPVGITDNDAQNWMIAKDPVENIWVCASINGECVSHNDPSPNEGYNFARYISTVEGRLQTETREIALDEFCVSSDTHCDYSSSDLTLGEIWLRNWLHLETQQEATFRSELALEARSVGLDDEAQWLLDSDLALVNVVDLISAAYELEARDNRYYLLTQVSEFVAVMDLASMESLHSRTTYVQDEWDANNLVVEQEEGVLFDDTDEDTKSSVLDPMNRVLKKVKALNNTCDELNKVNQLPLKVLDCFSDIRQLQLKASQFVLDKTFEQLGIEMQFDLIGTIDSLGQPGTYKDMASDVVGFGENLVTGNISAQDLGDGVMDLVDQFPQFNAEMFAQRNLAVQAFKAVLIKRVNWNKLGNQIASLATNKQYYLKKLNQTAAGLDSAGKAYLKANQRATKALSNVNNYKNAYKRAQNNINKFNKMFTSKKVALNRAKAGLNASKNAMNKASKALSNAEKELKKCFKNPKKCFGGNKNKKKKKKEKAKRERDEANREVANKEKDVSRAESQVAQAQNDLNNANQALMDAEASLRIAQNDHTVSQQQQEQAQVDYDKALAVQESAATHYDGAVASFDQKTEELAQAETDLEDAKAHLQKVKQRSKNKVSNWFNSRKKELKRIYEVAQGVVMFVDAYVEMDRNLKLYSAKYAIGNKQSQKKLRNDVKESANKMARAAEKIVGKDPAKILPKEAKDGYKIVKSIIDGSTGKQDFKDFAKTFYKKAVIDGSGAMAINVFNTHRRKKAVSSNKFTGYVSTLQAYDDNYGTYGLASALPSQFNSIDKIRAAGEPLAATSLGLYNMLCQTYFDDSSENHLLTDRRLKSAMSFAFGAWVRSDLPEDLGKQSEFLTALSAGCEQSYYHDAYTESAQPILLSESLSKEILGPDRFAAYIYDQDSSEGIVVLSDSLSDEQKARYYVQEMAHMAITKGADLPFILGDEGERFSQYILWWSAGCTETEEEAVMYTGQPCDAPYVGGAEGYVYSTPNLLAATHPLDMWNEQQRIEGTSLVVETQNSYIKLYTKMKEAGFSATTKLSGELQLKEGKKVNKYVATFAIKLPVRKEDPEGLLEFMGKSCTLNKKKDNCFVDVMYLEISLGAKYQLADKIELGEGAGDTFGLQNAEVKGEIGPSTGLKISMPIIVNHGKDLSFKDNLIDGTIGLSASYSFGGVVKLSAKAKDKRVLAGLLASGGLAAAGDETRPFAWLPPIQPEFSLGASATLASKSVIGNGKHTGGAAGIVTSMAVAGAAVGCVIDLKTGHNCGSLATQGSSLFSSVIGQWLFGGTLPITIRDDMAPVLSYKLSAGYCPVVLEKKKADNSSIKVKSKLCYSFSWAHPDHNKIYIPITKKRKPENYSNVANIW